MPTIQDASIKITNFPNKFASPFGNDDIVPLYSSVPLKSPVEGCLDCVVCGSSPTRYQIISNEGGLYLDESRGRSRFSEVEITPTEPIPSNCFSGGTFSPWIDPEVTVSGTWQVNFTRTCIGFSCVYTNFHGTMNVSYLKNNSYYGTVITNELNATLNSTGTLWSGTSTQTVTPPIGFQQGGTGPWVYGAGGIDQGFWPEDGADGQHIDTAPQNPPIGTGYFAAMAYVNLLENACGPIEADFIVLRSLITDGSNLNTSTRLISPESGTFVGYCHGDSFIGSNGLIWYEWAGDNTGTGYEAVLINVKNIRSAHPDSDIFGKCFGNWFGQKVSGNVTVSLTAYQGGTMEKDGFDYINVGGTQISQISKGENSQSNHANCTLGDLLVDFKYTSSNELQWI